MIASLDIHDLFPRDCYSFPRFTLLLPSVCNLHHAIFTYPRERITQFIITFAFFFYLYVFSEFSYFLFFPIFCKTEEKKSFSKENKVTFGKCIFHAPLFIHASHIHQWVSFNYQNWYKQVKYIDDLGKHLPHNHWANFNQVWHKSFLGKGVFYFLFKKWKGLHKFLRVYNCTILNKILKNFKK